MRTHRFEKNESTNHDGICYLDGRVIARAVKDAGCNLLYKHPMHIDIEEIEGGIKSYSVTMNERELLPTVNVIRVIIVSQYMRHSALLFLDMDSRISHPHGNANDPHDSSRRIGTSYWWNPRTKSKRSDSLDAIIKTLVREHLKPLAVKELITLDSVITNRRYSKGLCNAFVLKYILDWFNGNEVSFYGIHEFAHQMTNKYEWMLCTGEPDVEYDFNPSGALLGGLGGALIGGALLGPVGLVAGGALGTVGGAAVSNRHYGHYSKEENDTREDRFRENYSHTSDKYSRHSSRALNNGTNGNSREGGALLGGLGGMAIGGALGGGTGMMLGGLGGAMIGGGMFSESDSKVSSYSLSDAKACNEC